MIRKNAFLFTEYAVNMTAAKGNSDCEIDNTFY